MYRHLQIGPAAVQTSLVLYLLAFYLATEIARRYTKRHDLEEGPIQNALFLGFIMGLIGARVSYAVQHWAAYQDDLGAWFSITPQGLNTAGGLIIGSATIFFVIWRQNINIETFLDIIAPGAGLFMVIIPLAFLADGTVIGKSSDLPWAINLWEDTRHPTQLYAALGALITLGLWWRWRTYLIIVGGNALIWLVVGLALAEPALVLDTYRLVQVLAWIALMATALMAVRHEHNAIEAENDLIDVPRKL